MAASPLSYQQRTLNWPGYPFEWAGSALLAVEEGEHCFLGFFGAEEGCRQFGEVLAAGIDVGEQSAVEEFLGLAQALWGGLQQREERRADGRVQVVARHRQREQSQPCRFQRVEPISGEEGVRRRAVGEPGEHRQRDRRRGQPEPYFGQREARALTGDA